MTGIDIVEKLAELQRQYADAHRPVWSLEVYRKRHARRHPELDCDGESRNIARATNRASRERRRMSWASS